MDLQKYGKCFYYCGLSKITLQMLQIQNHKYTAFNFFKIQLSYEIKLTIFQTLLFLQLNYKPIYLQFYTNVIIIIIIIFLFFYY